MDIYYDGMEVLFQLHLWDQSQVIIVRNTRETGNMNTFGPVYLNEGIFSTVALTRKVAVIVWYKITFTLILLTQTKMYPVGNPAWRCQQQWISKKSIFYCFRWFQVWKVGK